MEADCLRASQLVAWQEALRSDQMGDHPKLTAAEALAEANSYVQTVVPIVEFKLLPASYYCKKEES